MGTFCTTTSLATLMPGISFDTGTTNLASKCVDWAESYCKQRLSRRYDVSALPFTVHTTSSMLTGLAEQLAMGHLYKNMSRGSKESIGRGDALLKEAKDAIEAIMKHKSDLLDAATGGTPVTERTNLVTVLASYTAYHTTFDEDDPLNWLPDEDKLTDIEDGRL